jgi:hypothetical protein
MRTMMSSTFDERASEYPAGILCGPYDSPFRIRCPHFSSNCHFPTRVVQPPTSMSPSRGDMDCKIKRSMHGQSPACGCSMVLTLFFLRCQRLPMTPWMPTSASRAPSVCPPKHAQPHLPARFFVPQKHTVLARMHAPACACLNVCMRPV